MCVWCFDEMMFSFHAGHYIQALYMQEVCIPSAGVLALPETSKGAALRP